MKNLLFTFLMLATSFVSAQDITTFGVKGGFNTTNLSEVHGDSGPRYGFHLGGFAAFPLSDAYMFYVQPEIIYSMQGEKNTTASKDELYKLDYINVPILFKPYFSEKDTSFYALIGPQLGFLVSESVKTNGQEQAEIYQDDTYSKFDLGVLAGLGFSLNRNVEFEIRYNYGFMDVVDDGTGNDTTKNRTSNLHFSINYRIWRSY